MIKPVASRGSSASPLPLEAVQKLPITKRLHEAIKAATLIGFGELASTFSAQKGKMIKIQGFHAGFNALSKKQVHEFPRKYVIGNARNIAKREVISNKEDLAESLDLLRKVKSSTLPDDIYLKSNFNPNHAFVDGICGGIQIDNAVKILKENKSVEQVILEGVHGASKEAAANQAIYEGLTSNVGMRDIVTNFLKMLNSDP